MADAKPRQYRAQPPRPCQWCGQEFRPKVANAKTCSTACRTARNNNRKKWGPVLLDMMMAQQYDRDAAKAVGLDRTTIHRLLQIVNRADRNTDGRRTWNGAREVMEEYGPMLSARVFNA